MFRIAVRRLGGAAAINGGGFILASFVTVAWYFLLVRHYAAGESGQFLLALSVAGLINLLDFGVSMGLVRVISAGDSIAHAHAPLSYFRAAIAATCLTELLVGSVGVWAWHSNSSESAPLIACVCIVGFALATEAVLLCVSVFKGLCEFKAANLISTGSTLVVYGAGSACIAVGLDAWSLLLLMTLFQGCCAGAAFYFTRHRLKSRLGSATRTESMMSTYVALLRVSLAFFPQLSTGIFFMHAQRFLIARYAGVDFVTVTSFAYSVATRIHAVANAFLEVIFPMAKQLRAEGLKAVSFCMRFGAVSAAAYVIAAALVGAVVSLLLPAITPTLTIFSLGVAFAVAVVPAYHLLNGSGASSQVSLCSLLSPFIFVCLVPVLRATTTLPASLVMPTAYALAMAFMVPHVAVLVLRHARHFDLGSGRSAIPKEGT